MLSFQKWQHHIYQKNVFYLKYMVLLLSLFISMAFETNKEVPCFHFWFVCWQFGPLLSCRNIFSARGGELPWIWLCNYIIINNLNKLCSGFSTIVTTTNSHGRNKPHTKQYSFNKRKLYRHALYTTILIA